MRDIGLEDDCVRLGNRGESIDSIRWCYSMSSVEYGGLEPYQNAYLRRNQLTDFKEESTLGVLVLPKSCVRYGRIQGSG